ncbi:restriction endonuclease subunit S [Lapidilactobacillus gannanensis]|uniref:Restriction endonuclease subunit S n=1 Tax=Lapidilactobacillus gannanensis TaxID=2486002 RepID=A0ABW4BL69_9LACO|nr:restriction endonuclease subunit S [Lapidilactobacillus gannanensis]
MENEKIGIPKLRFPGYTDAWEERKLGEVGKTKSGIGFPDAQQGGKQGTPFYKVSDMNNPGNEVVMMSANNYASDSQLRENKWNPINPQNSGVVFAKVGAAIFLDRKRIVDTSFLIDNNMMSYLFDSSWNRYFGKTLFEKLRLSRFAQVGALPSFNGSDVEDIKVMIPEESEQKVIGDMFEKLDDTIALHQRKLDDLKKRKSGLLQKMFPRDGEDVPELRFPGYTDAWEQRKLSDFSKTTYGGGTPKTAVTEYWDGNIPWIQSSNLTVDDVQKVNLDKFITDDAIKNSAAKLIPANSIAIVTRVGVGKLTLMKQEFATSQDFLSLSELHVDEQFGLYSIYKLLQKELNNVQGTSIKGMTKADLLTKDIMIPVEKDEQIKIGSFFKQLDHLITLHQRQLDHLKLRKKALLQQMFV